MLSEADRKKAAQLLLTAERDRKPMVQLSSTWPSITFEDAYAIQNEVQQQKMAEGRKLIGHKVGLTSKAMQQSSQINEPDYGHLLDDMMIADGAKVPHANYCAPRVEVELAFILGTPLQGPGVGLTDVLRATEYVVPALEIVDARVQNPRAPGAKWSIAHSDTSTPKASTPRSRSASTKSPIAHPASSTVLGASSRLTVSAISPKNARQCSLRSYGVPQSCA